MLQFRKLAKKETLLKLCKAFILPFFFTTVLLFGIAVVYAIPTK